MKKLLVVLCAAFVLAGCGGSGDSESTVKKTCKAEQEGIAITMDLEGKDDVLSKVSLNINAPYTAMAPMGLTKDMVDKADADVKKQASDTMKNVMLQTMNLDEDDGYTVTSDFDDEGWKMSVSAEASIFEQSFNATSMDEMVKELSDGGFTCE